MSKSVIGNFSMLPVIFVLTLFLLISVLSGAIVLAGNSIYSKIAVGMDRNFEKRVSLSYLSTKIRQNDVRGAIYSDNRDGVDLLVISEFFDDIEYVTYLYYYDGYIMELFLKKSNESVTGFEPAEGDSVIEVGGFEFITNNDSVELFVTDTTGGVKTLKIVLRSSLG